MQIFQKVLRPVLDLLLPQDATARQLSTLTPEAWAAQAGTSERALAENLIALAPYKNSLVRKTVWELKYKKNRDAARVVTPLLHEEIVAVASDLRLFESTAPLLITGIPLSRTSYRERGFNQTDLLLEVLQKHDAEDFCTYDGHVLEKVRETDHQTKLRRAERLQNMHEAFAVVPDKEHLVCGATVIVLDDVITTGATMAEARRALLQAKARAVFGLAIAH